MKKMATALNRKNTIWLGLVLGIALLIRLSGIGWGLPYVYHPDEPQVMVRYLRMIQTGDLNPHWFIYPAASMYINAAAFGVYYLVGKVSGFYHSPNDIALPNIPIRGSGIISDPAPFIVGRAVSIFAGLLAILLVYECAKRISRNEMVAALSALLMVISNVNITQSRLILPNIYVVLFVLLTLWFSLKILESGRLLDYLLAGAAAGLAAGSKYNGGLVFVAVLAAHFLRVGWRGWNYKGLFLAVFACISAFIISNPFILLDFPSFYKDFYTASQVYATGYLAMQGDAPLWYLQYLVSGEGFSLFLAVFAIILGVYLRDKQVILTAIFPVIYFAFISSFSLRNEQTVLVLIPFLYVLSAVAILFFVRKISAKLASKTARTVIFTGGICVLVAVPLLTSVPTLINTIAVDSRKTASTWIEQNIPPGSRIAIEAYSPYVDPKRYDLLVITDLVPPDYQWFADKKVQYVVFAQNMFGRYYSDPTKYGDVIRVYEQLFSALKPVKFFEDGGYEVKIYQLAKGANSQ